MVVTAAKRVRRVIKESRDWLAGRAPVAENSIASLHQDLAQRDLQGLQLAGASLNVLAVYFGREAQIRIIDGDASGWQGVHRAIAYHLWSLKISVQVFAKTRFLQPLQPVFDLTSETPIAASLHCYHLVTGDRGKQAFTFDILRNMATAEGVVNEAFRKRRVFEPFVLRLHQKQEPVELPEDLEERNIGPYAGVLEFWNVPERLGRAIEEVADYHCEKMFDRRGDWGPEFISAPFDLLPCDILAIFAVRRRLGLAVPAVDHPLLGTPLGTLGGDPANGMDATLRRVEDVYAEVFRA